MLKFETESQFFVCLNTGSYILNFQRSQIFLRSSQKIQFIVKIQALHFSKEPDFLKIEEPKNQFIVKMQAPLFLLNEKIRLLIFTIKCKDFLAPKFSIKLAPSFQTYKENRLPFQILTRKSGSSIFYKSGSYKFLKFGSHSVQRHTKICSQFQILATKISVFFENLKFGSQCSDV